jgi:hypothetical protein
MSQNTIPLSEMEQSPSAKWTQIGDTYRGRIVSMDKRQNTKPGSGEPVFFPSGDPQMVWVITIEQANGERVALWAGNGKYKAASGSGEAMLAAIGTAVRAAGANAVDIGAELAVAHSGMGEASPGKNPPRLFTAQYRQAAPESVPVDLFTT